MKAFLASGRETDNHGNPTREGYWYVMDATGRIVWGKSEFRTIAEAQAVVMEGM